jgi:DNA-binding CsgD family transcriptional regulator
MKGAADTRVWALVEEVASRPRQAQAWQRALAEAIAAAVGNDAVGVFLCPLGDMLEASVAMAPLEFQPLGERLIKEFLPRALRGGTVSPAALVGAAPLREDAEPEVPYVRAELLEPAGFEALIGRFLRAEGNAVAGWISIFTRAPAALRLPQIEEPFGVVCRSAESALRDCLTLAAATGARLPKLSPILLSERERAVASLAARSLSDANIAQQLLISEGTVGRHLHSIYRKLGVNSRSELADLLR